jgi:hypothetical protein
VTGISVGHWKIMNSSLRIFTSTFKQVTQKINWSDCLAIVTLILCGLIFTHRVAEITDVGLYDESNYLLWGFDYQKTLPVAENGSGYAFWYYLLSLIQPDRVTTYYLNAKLLTLLLPICIFITMRMMRFFSIVALFSSILFLVSVANFPMSPKVSQFGAIIMLSGISLALWAKTTQIKLCAFTLTALLVAYARPEFYISWVLLSVLLIVHLAFQIKENYQNTSKKSQLLGAMYLALPVVITLLLSFGLFAHLGKPMGDGSRSILAFGQHYAANWVVWNQSSLNPWTNWNSIFAIDFKGATSIGSAVMLNPTAVLHHVYSNVALLTVPLSTMATLIYPDTLWGLKPIYFKIGWIVTLVAYWCLFAFQLKKLSLKTRGTEAIQNESPWLILCCLTILLIPPTISVLVIGPREHYLLFVVLLATLLVVSLLMNGVNRFFTLSKIVSSKIIYPFALICVATIILIRPMYDFYPRQATDNLNTIRFIQTLNLQNAVIMLEAEGGYNIYLGDSFTRIPEYAKGENFAAFMQKHSINTIVVSGALRNDSRFKLDPEWLKFLNSPEEFGFSALDIPLVSDRKILIKKNK